MRQSLGFDKNLATGWRASTSYARDHQDPSEYILQAVPPPFQMERAQTS